MKFSRVLVSLFAVSLIGFVGCKKDDNGGGGGQTVPDPEGTITISMSNSGGGYIGGSGGFAFGTRIYFTPDGQGLVMNDSNNFYRWGDCSIASIGKVNGLASVTKVPSAGFSEQIAVEPGYGYVIKVDDVTYARLYVVEWVTSIYDEIIGAKVKYQYPFEP